LDLGFHPAGPVRRIEETRRRGIFGRFWRQGASLHQGLGGVELPAGTVEIIGEVLELIQG
jgi:hypothetical protein